MIHAGIVDRGVGSRITSNPKGVATAAARPAGMFSKGEIGEKRWKDSTMKGRNTISTAIETIAASPSAKKMFHGIVSVHVGNPRSSHHNRRAIRQSTTPAVR